MTPGALPYVPITRHFREVNDAPTDGRARRMLAGFRNIAPTTWADLLRCDAKERAPSAIVLMAPSGAGKSTEIRSQAERLRAEGHSAFYCEAGAVATDGLRDSLDATSAAQFDEWLVGTRPAIVFLDAVDEVYLRSRSFRDVTRQLRKEIDFGTREAQVVVTVRNGAWSSSDRNALVDMLRGRTENPSVQTVTFDPIDLPALRALVRAHGVEDVESFLRRFEEDELYDLLDLRPCDVALFVNHWNKHGAFKTWSEILTEFLESTFVEANPVHQPEQDLSLERGTKALRRIGAASVLTKRTHIALPSVAAPDGAMDGRRLFEDWQGRLLAELFANGIFVHKGEATVQLPQGALVYFLAAKWFGERFRKGWRADELRDSLFVRVFDETRWRVPESRLPLIGWVASEIPELRARLLETDPGVLLYEGDPKRLELHEIVAALRRVVESAVAQKGCPWPTRSTVRQLARPELADEILALLRRYRGSVDVEEHLLRFAELGRYQACVGHALELALDPGADASSRAAAVRVIAEAGGVPEHRALLGLVSEMSREIRAALIDALVPAHLSGEPLVQFLLRIDDDQLGHLVRRVADRLAQDDVDATLQGLLRSLQNNASADQRKAHFELGLVLVLARLRRPAASPPWLGDFFVVLEQDWDAHYVSKEDRTALQAHFEANITARRAVWEAKIRRADDVNVQISLSQPRLARLEPDDLPWLFDEHVRVAPEPQQRELVWAIDSFYRTSSDVTRASVRARTDLPVELASRFESIDAQMREADESARVRQEKENREREETRRKNIAALTPKTVALESGEDLSVLIWAWQQLEHPDTARGRIDIGQLRRLVGDELTECFARGFKACWRRQDVALPEPGSSTTLIATLAGLTGLTLEIRDGLELGSLSSAEAGLAARYAFRELNAFPYWFEDLLAAHKDAVRDALADVLESEWCASIEHHGVMRFAAQAPREVGLLMRSIVLALAETQPAGHPCVVRPAADALLISSNEADRVAGLARARIESSPEADIVARSGWLRVWAHLAPIAAADWLDELRDRSAEQFNRLVAATAERLEYDFDARSRTAVTAIMRPRALEKWIRLVHLAVRPEDDLKREGVYSPATRDNAEDFRRRCLATLAEDPSLEAYQALCRLRAAPELASYANLLERATSAQLSRAAEAAAAPWSEEAVVMVERGDERPPTSLEELFRLVQRHLSRVAELVENDDFSYRRLFTPETSEKEIQRWAASSLRLVCRDLYSVVRETELDDDKKVDISAVSAGIGRVPIEIKPLGPYSLADLQACVTAQLHGKYMQPTDVKYGVLLLVRQTDKQWNVNGELVGFPELVAAVRAFANQVGMQHDKVFAVATIDLLKSPDARRTS